MLSLFVSLPEKNQQKANMSESEGDSKWQQVHHYSDHLGHPVVLEEYVEPDWDPEPTHQVPIQVYSTVLLDQDHDKLRDYLLNSFYNEEVLPLFEIYSYCPPDTFACIEHHKREIAYRKQQHQAGAPNPPPLIPQFSGRYGSPIGCCVLLRSHSYHLGYIEDPDEYAEAGDSPDWLYFNRVFHTHSKIDQGHHAPSVQLYNNNKLHLGGFELSILPVRNQREMGQIIMCDIFHSALLTKDNTSLEYALDQDEGVSSDALLLSEEQICHQLDQQVLASDFVINQSFQISHEAGGMSITNTPEGCESDLQYLIFVPFLSHLQETEIPALLESTARLFTSSLVPHLRPRTTLNLKFYIPESNSWSTILPAYHNALSHQPTDFPIGALHTLSARGDAPPALHRVSPQIREYSVPSASLIRDRGESAVVLDRVNFVSDAGVFFYMTDYVDGDGSETDDSDMDGSDRPNTKIERSPRMADVARRLAMRVVEEE
ncbi:hypothetical protein BDW59DRAFT_154982 [Aspergillus cavernicola]|uniref:Uncharacterized protein n=1 Tax=Aspergillus cavernicola TaxID=176166 RepID=A0ABR4HC75_9EURO